MGKRGLKIATFIISVILLILLSASVYSFYTGNIDENNVLIYPIIVSTIILGFLISKKPEDASEPENEEVDEE